MGVTKRWDEAGTYRGKTGKQWMYIWIRNWNEAVSDGYPYAVSIRQQYNQTAMNTFLRSEMTRLTLLSSTLKLPNR
jgi:hypothetical protein